MTRSSSLSVASALLILSACGTPDRTPAPDPATSPELSQAVEATSLLGESLTRPALPEDFRQRQEALLAEARAAFDAARDDPDGLIWVGRRTAYLGRYQEAIDIFTDGIERWPDYAPLYRHRGHRYITTRQLDAAAEDLSRAAELVEGTPDVIEEDGLPNERGIPTSTLQSNIFYHLGLAHYLLGDFEQARDAYRRCLDVSSTEDNVVATTHWLYMTLRKLGLDAEAEAVLEPVRADMDIIENGDYHRLTLMYKGEVDPEALWREALTSEDSVGSATLGYGVGNWIGYAGLGDGPEPERALDVFAGIHSGDQSAAFGYIAAEAELVGVPSYQRQIHAWRSSRLRDLLATDGWLSLTGLFWLEEGAATFGTDPSADLVFSSDADSGDRGRATFGSIVVEDSGSEAKVFVEPEPGVDILVGGDPLRERLELASDLTGEPTEMEVAPFRFWLLERSERPFLRVIDLERATRAPIPRIPYYPIDESWRVRARFELYDPPKSIPVRNVLETTDQTPSPGALVFERHGREHRLDVLESGGRQFLVFADRTTGEATYGGGRYLYVDRADEDGFVSVDFNRAYNPPCVFTTHATCPLPPRQNRLDVAIEAGEKTVRGYLDH